jgi:hypothetical protein
MHINYAKYMSLFAKNFWIYTTCQINNDEGTGTGFFVRDPPNKRIFLVSNKHVLNHKADDEYPKKLNITFNIIQDGLVVRDGLQWEYDRTLFAQHPDNDTDIYIIDFTLAILLYGQQFEKEIRLEAIPLEYFATNEYIKKYDIKITDEVYVIGYPSTNKLRHSVANFPFVRQGMIASYIGEHLEDEFKDVNGVVRNRLLKAFLIDGGIIPGVSGSPVILRPTFFREINNQKLADNFPPLLLGIVSEYRGAFMSKHYGETFYSYANLGIAFDAEAIKETINLYNSIHPPNNFIPDKD